jgi:hypothetical protein
VTQQEKEQVQRDAQIYEVVTVRDDLVSSSSKQNGSLPKSSKYTPLPGGTKAEETEEAQGNTFVYFLSLRLLFYLIKYFL